MYFIKHTPAGVLSAARVQLQVSRPHTGRRATRHLAGCRAAAARVWAASKQKGSEGAGNGTGPPRPPRLRPAARCCPAPGGQAFPAHRLPLCLGAPGRTSSAAAGEELEPKPAIRKPGESPRASLLLRGPARASVGVCATRGVSRHERHLAFLGGHGNGAMVRGRDPAVAIRRLRVRLRAAPCSPF